MRHRLIATPALLAAYAASCIVQLQITSVNVALQQISTELTANMSDLQLVVVAYSLPFAVFLLSAGAAADRLGPRRVCIAGYVIFAAGSLVCAVAPRIEVLNMARPVQGIGAALLVPSSLTLLTRSCDSDKKYLARSVAVWYGIGGASFAAGPILAGLLLAIEGWRGIFFLNVPVCVIGVVLIGRDREDQKETMDRATGSFNWAGQILLLMTLSSLFITIVAYKTLGGSDPRVAMGIVGVLVIGAAFARIESRQGLPILPLALVRDIHFVAPIFFGLVIQTTYSGMFFVLSMYLQRTLSYDTVQTGMAFIPLTALLMPSNLVSGRLLAQFGFRLPMAAGALLAALGYCSLVFLDSRSTFVEMLPGFLLIAFGMGLTVPAVMAAMLSIAAKRWSGIASATVNAARQIGSAAGVAAFGSLISQETGSHIVAGMKIASVASAGLLFIAAGCVVAMPSRKVGDRLPR